MLATIQLTDVTGFRGEKIVELCLTDYSAFVRPLFRPAFLGDKWPAVDFYVELNGVRNRRPYFLVQVKATARPLSRDARQLKISATKTASLMRIPGPTFVFGVHEPTKRVFIKSVHMGIAAKAIDRIQLSNETDSSQSQAIAR